MMIHYKSCNLEYDHVLMRFRLHEIGFTSHTTIVHTEHHSFYTEQIAERHQMRVDTKPSTTQTEGMQFACSPSSCLPGHRTIHLRHR